MLLITLLIHFLRLNLTFWTYLLISVSCWMLSGVCDVGVKQEHLGGGADVSPCTAVRYRSRGWN